MGGEGCGQAGVGSRRVRVFFVFFRLSSEVGEVKRRRKNTHSVFQPRLQSKNPSLRLVKKAESDVKKGWFGFKAKTDDAAAATRAAAKGVGSAARGAVEDAESAAKGAVDDAAKQAQGWFR